MKYKIYCLKNPDTLEIRYVGVTTLKLNQRLSQHKCAAFTTKAQTHCAKWIRSMKKAPIIELIEICTGENWEEREKYWISYYNNLTNINPGGKGIVVDRKLDAIERSAAARRIPVVQIDENGNYVKTWSSSKEACEYYSISHSSISNVLNPYSKSVRAAGFFWMRLKDYEKFKFNLNGINSFRITVYLYTSDNKFFKKFNSKTEAANFLNTYVGNINKVIDSFTKKGIPRTCKQYIIKSKYIEDIV